MEYRLGKKIRIFAIASSILIVVLGAGCIINSFVPPADKADGVLLGTGIFMLVIGAYCWLEIVQSKLIILRDVVSIQQAFYTRTLHTDDIAGYRELGRNKIRIVPVNPCLKRIDVSAHMEGQRELLLWLARFPNLDAVEYQAEATGIFSNEQFGATETERLHYLRKAKGTVQAGNIVALLATGWLWVWPRPYDMAMISGLLLPWIGIWLAWRFKGLVKPGSPRKGSPHPSVVGLLFLPVMGLLFRIIFDYKIYDPARVWIPLLVAALPIAGIYLYTGIKAFAIKRKVLGALVLGVLATVYSFTLVIFTNCYYNASPPREFTVGIKGKHSVKDKTTTYYLTLEPWGRFTAKQDESVERALYEKVPGDGQVHIYLLEGKWGIPWYYITE